MSITKKACLAGGLNVTFGLSMTRTMELRAIMSRMNWSNQGFFIALVQNSLQQEGRRCSGTRRGKDRQQTRLLALRDDDLGERVHQEWPSSLQHEAHAAYQAVICAGRPMRILSTKCHNSKVRAPTMRMRAAPAACFETSAPQACLLCRAHGLRCYSPSPTHAAVQGMLLPAPCPVGSACTASHSNRPVHGVGVETAHSSWAVIIICGLSTA